MMTPGNEDDSGTMPPGTRPDFDRTRTSLATSTVANAQQQALEPAALRVLVVEDDDIVRRGLILWLGKRGIQVLEASDLLSATMRAIDQRPDVILLDVRLGTEDGLQLVELLRGAGLRIPIVVLTGHAGPYDGFRAHELGVAELIEKPSSPDKITAVLRRIVATNCTASGLSGQEPLNGSLDVGEGFYVNSALKLITENFQTKGLSLGQVARSVGISSSHLSRLFRQRTGSSVMGRLHHLRVIQAATLLVTTHKSVKVVAEECGYHGSAELHRHFSRTYGKSPIVFRRQNFRSKDTSQN